MMYLGEDELTQVMGLGYPGEVGTGPDGNLYQWVEGYDGLGTPVGFWRRLRRFARRALPFAQRVASMIPHPYARAVAAGLRVATPLLQRRRRVYRRRPMWPVVQPVAPAAAMPAEEALAPSETTAAGWGLGALYQAPDGTLYQVQGFAEDEELRGLAEDEELRGLAEDEELRGFAEDEELRGYDSLGALYQAPDGTLYQVQGLSEDEELRGFAEDEDLRGLAEDEDLRGLAEDEELRGLAEDEDLRGLAEDEELRGFAEDEDLRGLAEDEELRGFAEDEEIRGWDGYVRQEGMSGLEAFVPHQPPSTRWFTPPAQPPEMWRPLW